MLLVEDDRESLARSGRCSVCSGSKPGRSAPWGARALADQVDLVLLDLGLPDGDGMALCRGASHGRVPVIVLTARDTQADRISGLEAGADDYVSKPFDARELVSRCHAVLRRAGMPRVEPDVTVEFGLGHLLQPRSGHAQRIPLALTIKERELLFALARRRGAMASRGELISEVWGREALEGDNTLRVHLSSLRRKLDDDPTNPRYLVTVRGAGVRLRVDG